MGYVEAILPKCRSFPHIEQLHAHLLVTGLSKFLDFCVSSSATTLPYAGEAAVGYVETILQKCRSFTHIEQLHAHLLATGRFHQFQPRSKFLDFCATSSSATLPYAAAVFRFIPFPTTNDWNALIRGYSHSHYPINAIKCYLSMSRAPCNPDALTCSFFLKACGRAFARIESLQMHAQVLKSGFDEDVLLQTTLYDLYVKFGDFDSAYKLFDVMPKTDIACWNVLISGLAQWNRPHEALNLFYRMAEDNYGGREVMTPNEITVLGALHACSQLGAISEADKLFGYIRRNHFDENAAVCNAVIDMYSKCGMVEKAYAVFEGMRCCRSIITWNTMIMGLAMNSNGMKALEVFSRMARGGAGPKPDGITFLAVLSACIHAGMVNEGVQVFEMMKKLRVSRTIKHYRSVVDLLARAGRLDEAFSTAESMQIPADALLWQTLLSASKAYGNVKMAEKVSMKLEAMESGNSGDFMQLNGMMWDNEESRGLQAKVQGIK